VPFLVCSRDAELLLSSIDADYTSLFAIELRQVATGAAAEVEDSRAGNGLRGNQAAAIITSADVREDVGQRCTALWRRRF
jgi:hypothetical protein